jgi:hypothetical protein
MQKRIAKWVNEQYYKDGILYTILKATEKPRAERGGRLMPVFAKPVSRYRAGWQVGKTLL